uniref:ANK_REP_REGION domain-containing protein n=1 Tax=Bursaphelenchus xylophilus TaxID=6326 RepID=A0A1I7SFT5_BURXY
MNRYRDYVKWTRRVSQVTCRERELSPFEFVQSLEKLLTEADVLNMKLDESEEIRGRIKDANWKIRASSLVDSHARCQARSLLLKAQSGVVFEEELNSVDMAELDELRAYAKGNWSQKQSLFVETLLGDLDKMRREAVEKLSQVNDFLTASSSKNPPKNRGFAEVFKFAKETVGCIDWLAENLMLEFREELKVLEEASSNFRKLASGQPMKLASIYQLMRQMDRNRLLINPTELDDVEVFRDNSLKFIEEIHNAVAKEGTYHSAVQCLLPRKDLITMIEEASEKLYKQSRDNFSEEWPELKSVLSAEDVEAMFPTYDLNESMRLLRAARERNAQLPTYKTCIESPGCSKKLSEEEKESTIECFVCLQKQHTSCAIWSTALDRYPDGLYICHRCCRSQRPTIESIEKLVKEGPKESLEMEFVRMATADIRNQWEETLNMDIEQDGDQTPLIYALTLELHDPQAFEVLINRFKPSFTEAQKSGWRKIKENNPEMPLTTSGIKDSLLGGKRRRFKCLRIRPGLGSPIKRKGAAPERCAAGTCLKYKGRLR